VQKVRGYTNLECMTIIHKYVRILVGFLINYWGEGGYVYWRPSLEEGFGIVEGVVPSAVEAQSFPL